MYYCKCIANVLYMYCTYTLHVFYMYSTCTFLYTILYRTMVFFQVMYLYCTCTVFECTVVFIQESLTSERLEESRRKGIYPALVFTSVQVPVYRYSSTMVVKERNLPSICFHHSAGTGVHCTGTIVYGSTEREYTYMVTNLNSTPLNCIKQDPM